MRTTVTIDGAVYRRAKAYAAEQGLPVGSVLEDALRLLLDRRVDSASSAVPDLPTHPGGLRPGFDTPKASEIRHELDLEDHGRAVR